MKSLTELRDAALANAIAHGFTEASVLEDFAMIHSEISEALEDFRTGHAPHHAWYEYKDGRVEIEQNREGSLKPSGIPSEMADVLIRVLHFCGRHKIDIEKAVEEKMAYNASRPFKHGNKVL